jgi:hypothetical protein
MLQESCYLFLKKEKHINHNIFNLKFPLYNEVTKMKELKGFPFEPLSDTEPLGEGDGPGSGIPC